MKPTNTDSALEWHTHSASCWLSSDDASLVPAETPQNGSSYCSSDTDYHRWQDPRRVPWHKQVPAGLPPAPHVQSTAVRTNYVTEMTLFNQRWIKKSLECSYQRWHLAFQVSWQSPAQALTAHTKTTCNFSCVQCWTELWHQLLETEINLKRWINLVQRLKKMTKKKLGVRWAASSTAYMLLLSQSEWRYLHALSRVPHSKQTGGCHAWHCMCCHGWVTGSKHQIQMPHLIITKSHVWWQLVEGFNY